jgi:hypothetical protein
MLSLCKACRTEEACKVCGSVSYTALFADLNGVLAFASSAATVGRTHGPASVATATRRSMPRIQQNASMVWRFMMLPFFS